MITKNRMIAIGPGQGLILKFDRKAEHAPISTQKTGTGLNL